MIDARPPSTGLRAALGAALGAARGDALRRLLAVEAAPAPFDGGTEARIDLPALSAGLEGLDLAALPGVPARAVRARQLAFVGGRLCAEQALAAAGQTGTGGVGADAQGRPVWPAGWTGSITHAAGVAIAAVMRRDGLDDIGLDTEALLRDEALCDAVRSQCLCEAERERPDIAGDRLALTVLFSAKEAYYKAVSRRVARYVDFQEMALQSIDRVQGRFRLVPVRWVPGAPGGAGELPAADGHFECRGERVVTRIRLPGAPPGAA